MTQTKLRPNDYDSDVILTYNRFATWSSLLTDAVGLVGIPLLAAATFGPAFGLLALPLFVGMCIKSAHNHGTNRNLFHFDYGYNTRYAREIMSKADAANTHEAAAKMGIGHGVWHNFYFMPLRLSAFLLKAAASPTTNKQLAAATEQEAIKLKDLADANRRLEAALAANKELTAKLVELEARPITLADVAAKPIDALTGTGQAPLRAAPRTAIAAKTATHG